MDDEDSVVTRRGFLESLGNAAGGSILIKAVVALGIGQGVAGCSGSANASTNPGSSTTGGAAGGATPGTLPGTPGTCLEQQRQEIW